MCSLAMITLVLSALLILASCYTYFDNQLKKEVKSEALLVASFINNFPSVAEGMSKLDKSERRITLISHKGEVIYDNSQEDISNHIDRPEVKSALEKGEGSAKRYSKTAKSSMHYHAVRLDSGDVIRVSAKSNMPSMFYTILVAVFLIIMLMYILCAIVANRLTDSIVSPIEKLNPFDTNDIENTYEEIRPFLMRIAKQNEEITRQTGRVTEQKARLQAIMDNINEGLVIIDTDARILSINEPARETLGISKSELKHKNITELTDSEKILTVIKKALLGEKNNTMFESNERWYEIFFSPIFEDDIISGAVFLLFDVTERTNTEKIRREFTANVSHELKTPLTTIHGYSQIIDSGIAKEEDIKGFVKKIEKESSRLMALVDDIIALSRLDEQSGDLPKESFPLKAAVTEALEALMSKAKERGISLTYECDDSIVYANMAQCVEMIYNLTDNAIKYNKPDGSVRVVSRNMSVSVTDTGIGIAEKYTDRVFERFFRVDKSHSKKVNGTGLGLSIVKHLAKANNAQIDLKSSLGEGSTFTITFSK